MANEEDVNKINDYYEDKILEDLFNDSTIKNIKVPTGTVTTAFKGSKFTTTSWANLPSDWMSTNSKEFNNKFYWSSEPAQPARAIDQRKEIEQDVQTVDFE